MKKKRLPRKSAAAEGCAGSSVATVWCSASCRLTFYPGCGGPLDLCQDVGGAGGPDEGLGIFVVTVDIVPDRQDELLQIAKHATAQPVLSEVAEEALHHVEPRRTGRSEWPRVRGIARPRAAFCGGEPRNFALSLCSWGGPQTRRAPLERESAEARSAASAQASFPARRAREKRGVEKENGTKRNQSQTGRRNPTVGHRFNGRKRLLK